VPFSQTITQDILIPLAEDEDDSMFYTQLRSTFFPAPTSPCSLLSRVGPCIFRPIPYHLPCLKPYIWRASIADATGYSQGIVPALPLPPLRFSKNLSRTHAKP
jgi:hypothetical protein